MPLIQIKYSTPKSRPGLVKDIATTANRLSSEFLRKDPSVTAVVAEEIPAERWFCGNRSLADDGLASFSLDIKIVEATNTKDEEAKFIAETFRAMTTLLGPLHEESYVYVDEVHGHAYGFGGVTQERRHIARTLPAPTRAAVMAI
jgi:4-oxalocrotonate tautomerase